MVNTEDWFCKIKIFIFRHIADLAGTPEIILPTPAFNVINGGSHAGNKLAMQEFMIFPTGKSYKIWYCMLCILAKLVCFLRCIVLH